MRRVQAGERLVQGQARAPAAIEAGSFLRFWHPFFSYENFSSYREKLYLFLPVKKGKISYSTYSTYSTFQNAKICR